MKHSVVLTVACASLLASPVLGQGTLSEEMRKAILEYPLTLDGANHLLDAIEPMTRHVLALPNAAEVTRRSQKMTLPERIAQTENDAQSMNILRAHQLSARDYVVGVPTLRLALAAASSSSAGNDRLFVASPANLAFAKANLTTLKPRLDAIDRGVAAKPPPR